MFTSCCGCVNKKSPKDLSTKNNKENENDIASDKINKNNFDASSDGGVDGNNDNIKNVDGGTNENNCSSDNKNNDMKNANNVIVSEGANGYNTVTTTSEVAANVTTTLTTSPGSGGDGTEKNSNMMINVENGLNNRVDTCDDQKGNFLLFCLFFMMYI